MIYLPPRASPVAPEVKNPPTSAGDMRDSAEGGSLLPPNRSPTPLLVFTPKYQTRLVTSYCFALTSSVVLCYLLDKTQTIVSPKALWNPSPASSSAGRLYQALSTWQAALQVLQCKFFVSS